MAEQLAAAVTIATGCIKLCVQCRSGAFSDQIRHHQFEVPKSQLQIMQAFKNNLTRVVCDEGTAEYLLVSKVRKANNKLEDVVFKIVLLEEALEKTGGIMNQLRNIYHKLVLSRIEHSGVRLVMNDIIAIFSEMIQLQAAPASGRFLNVECGSTSLINQRAMQTSPPKSDHPIIGFEEDTKKLVAYLKREDCPWRVFCIWGEGGSGKSSLAGEIYKREEVENHFECFAWVSPEKKETKDVLEAILYSLSNGAKIDSLRLQELEEKVSGILKQKKCLVVLDNVSSTEMWDLLKEALFPTDDSKSKLLLTTRKKNVAQHVDRNHFLFKPSYLDRNNGQELIKACLAGNNIDLESDGDMKALVEKMLDHCVDSQNTILPNAIIVLRQLILSGKDNILDLEERLRNREKLCLLEGKIHEQEDSSHTGLYEVFYRSYCELLASDEKKSFYQHLANFPEKIRVTELCQLWMAEVHGKCGTSPKFNEKDAYDLLEDLVKRSMVSIVDISSTGRIKTVRLNGLMRDFCVLLAKKDEFVQVIDSQNVHEAIGSSSSGRVAKHVPRREERRLAINDVAMDANKCRILAKDTAYRTLFSFMCFETLPAGSAGLEKLLNHWTKLRVLKLEKQQSFVKLPKWIGKLVCLIFLSLKDSNIAEVPSSIGKLEHLQTLDLRTEHRLVLPNVIRKLKLLRHLYLPHEGYSVKGGKKLRVDGLKHLQVLFNSPLEECDLDVLVTQLPELKKLVLVRTKPGRISIRPTTSGRKFAHLKSLTVENPFDDDVDITPILSCSENSVINLRLNGIRTLPEVTMFPPNLRKVTLKNAYLRRDPMATLGKLRNLRVLRLLGKVFTNGTKMNCLQGDFKHLEFLRLEEQENLEWLNVEGSLSSLQHLEFVKCEKLRPNLDALRHAPLLKEIVIREMPEQFRGEVQGAFPFLTSIDSRRTY